MRQKSRKVSLKQTARKSKGAPSLATDVTLSPSFNYRVVEVTVEFGGLFTLYRVGDENELLTLLAGRDQCPWVRNLCARSKWEETESNISLCERNCTARNNIFRHFVALSHSSTGVDALNATLVEEVGMRWVNYRDNIGFPLQHCLIWSNGYAPFISYIDKIEEMEGDHQSSVQNTPSSILNSNAQSNSRFSLVSSCKQSESAGQPFSAVFKVHCDDADVPIPSIETFRESGNVPPGAWVLGLHNESPLVEVRCVAAADAHLLQLIEQEKNSGKRTQIDSSYSASHLTEQWLSCITREAALVICPESLNEVESDESLVEKGHSTEPHGIRSPLLEAKISLLVALCVEYVYFFKCTLPSFFCNDYTVFHANPDGTLLPAHQQACIALETLKSREIPLSHRIYSDKSSELFPSALRIVFTPKVEVERSVELRKPSVRGTSLCGLCEAEKFPLDIPASCTIAETSSSYDSRYEVIANYYLDSSSTESRTGFYTQPGTLLRFIPFLVSAIDFASLHSLRLRVHQHVHAVFCGHEDDLSISNVPPCGPYRLCTVCAPTTFASLSSAWKLTNEDLCETDPSAAVLPEAATHSEEPTDHSALEQYFDDALAEAGLTAYDITLFGPTNVPSQVIVQNALSECVSEARRLLTQKREEQRDEMLVDVARVRATQDAQAADTAARLVLNIIAKKAKAAGELQDDADEKDFSPGRIRWPFRLRRLEASGRRLIESERVRLHSENVKRTDVAVQRLVENTKIKSTFETFAHSRFDGLSRQGLVPYKSTRNEEPKLPLKDSERARLKITTSAERKRTSQLYLISEIDAQCENDSKFCDRLLALDDNLKSRSLSSLCEWTKDGWLRKKRFVDRMRAVQQNPQNLIFCSKVGF